MSLINIIQSTVQNWQNKTAAAIHSELSAAVVVPDATLYTGKHVFNVLADIDAYRLVAGTIQSAAAQDPLVSDVQLWLGSNGVDFSADATQGMIVQLAQSGSWSDAVRDAILAIGKRPSTVWVEAGGEGSVPSESEIGVAVLKQVKEDAAVDRLQAYREALAAWDGNANTEPSL